MILLTFITGKSRESRVESRVGRELAIIMPHPAVALASGQRQNISDSNIGARKDMNVRNHLFIIYGVINNDVKDEEECVDLQVYDIVQAFDSFWIEDCMNDLVDTISDEKLDDKIALLYKLNENNMKLSKVEDNSILYIFAGQKPQ